MAEQPEEDLPPPPNQLALGPQQRRQHVPYDQPPYPPVYFPGLMPYNYPPPFYQFGAPQAWHQPQPQPQPQPLPQPLPQPQPQPGDQPLRARRAPTREAGAKPAKERPNAQPRPGVFRFPVIVETGDEKREFSGETDMSWEDFHDRVKAYLDGSPKPIKLVYRITGERGKAINLTDAEDFATAMGRICDKANHARTRAAGMEIKNATKATKAKGKMKGKKRAREDSDSDVAPDDNNEADTQLKAYKRLEPAVRCEAHQGHCFIDRTGSQENHRRLTHGEMTLWAKKISLGEATIYDPPHCLNFDRGPTKRPRNAKTPQIPQVHVTINASPLGYQVEAPVTTTTPPLPSATREATPFDQSEASSASLGTRAASQDTPGPATDLEERRLAAVQDLTRPPKAAPGHVVYPHLSLVIALLDLDYPHHRFRDCQQTLLNMGIDDACKLILLPQDALSAIVGAERAQCLHRYAGYGVGPVFGLQCPVREAFTPLAARPATVVPAVGNMGESEDEAEEDKEDEDEEDVEEEEEEDEDEDEDEEDEEEDELEDDLDG